MYVVVVVVVADIARLSTLFLTSTYSLATNLSALSHERDAKGEKGLLASILKTKKGHYAKMFVCCSELNISLWWSSTLLLRTRTSFSNDKVHRTRAIRLFGTLFWPNFHMFTFHRVSRRNPSPYL